MRSRVGASARLRGDFAAAAAACRLAEVGLQPRLDKFGGLSLYLAELRSPESLDGATFQGLLRGKSVLLLEGESAGRGEAVFQRWGSSPGP